jgi:hypothetical protein
MKNSAGKKSTENPTPKGEILTWTALIVAAKRELLASARRRRDLRQAIRVFESLRDAEAPPVPLPPKRATSRFKPSGKKSATTPQPPAGS